MNDYALYIGRFQPFHNGHLASLRHAFTLAKKLIIILGGYQLAPSVTDPWSVSERKKMILGALTSAEKKRIQFIFIRDRLYNEDLWRENLIREVQFLTKRDSKIVIVGHMKDNTSYYLKIFPQWSPIETGNFYGLSSTPFREQYFLKSHPSYENVPKSVASFLRNFRKKRLFHELKEDYKFDKSNVPRRRKFSYLCLFLGHYILLEKRTYFPGKDLYCLPSYHPSNTNNPEYKSYFVEKKTFYLEKYDGKLKQGKSVFLYRLPPFASLPVFLDKKYSFVLFDDLYSIEDKFFADHYQIIKTLVQS